MIMVGRTRSIHKQLNFHCKKDDVVKNWKDKKGEVCNLQYKNADLCNVSMEVMGMNVLIPIVYQNEELKEYSIVFRFHLWSILLHAIKKDMTGVLFLRQKRYII